VTQPEFSAPLLSDRYQPTLLLARGGSASVFRASDLLLGRDVAVKIFRAGGIEDVERFSEELRMVAGLGHHGVVSVLDAGVDHSSPDDPRPFLVMELVPGRSVRQVLDEGELAVPAIGGIAFEVAEALAYVHARGVIHRDITPSNIMLVDYGTAPSRPRARLTDFGIALHADDVTDPEDLTTEGTAAYLSPEQATRAPLTPATDIYSLGLVLLECFTRTLAFPGDPIESAMARVESDPDIPDSVPKPWRGLIADMTRRKPSRRPTAPEVMDAARKALRSSGRHTR